MARRYEKTTKKYSGIKGKKSYSTTFYRKVPEKDTDMYFISQEGDRCDNLAFRFYGDPSYWWFIAKINNLKTMNIPPGISLRIPASTIDAEEI